MALAFVVLAGGCGNPASETLPGESSSSGAGGASSSGASSSGSGSSGSVPQREPPEPFVLPEGCGDGIGVSGQYDCHFPVSLEYLKEAMGAKQDPIWFLGWDMDGDGRDELLAQAPGYSPTRRLIAPLRWNGESFDVGRVAGGNVDPGLWTPHFDIDRDGQPDFVRFPGNNIAHFLVSPSFELDDEQEPARFDVATWGRAGPLDIDSDGQLEALAVRWPRGGPRELWLHRNVAGTWMPVGEALELPGCRWPENYTWADFDADGHEDVAVLNFPHACDDYPTEYDPSWHTISLFLNEPSTQTLVSGPMILVGAITGESFWLEDFDGDGVLDFLVEIRRPSGGPAGVALVRGRGDGSFDEGVPIVLPDIPIWKLEGRGDLDGDGDVDWILTGDTVVDDIFAAEPEIVHVRSDVIGIDGEPWANTRAFGDFNGDAVIDYPSVA